MPVFISYNREDSHFVDTLASNLVMRRHHIWMDRWELNVGDSIIGRIQQALDESSAILVILSQKSVASEWCKKELSSGLIRELDEKRVIVLPCLIDDCQVPLFLRDKMYADFRKDPDTAFGQVDDALLKITNIQQGKLESPDFHTDWSYDWKLYENSSLRCFDWAFVGHGQLLDYCTLTRCEMICNPLASLIFAKLPTGQKEPYIHRAFSMVVDNVISRQFKFRLSDAFEQRESFTIKGLGDESWRVQISCRRMGSDNGKDTLVHIDTTFAGVLGQIRGRVRPDTKIPN